MMGGTLRDRMAGAVWNLRILLGRTEVIALFPILILLSYSYAGDAAALTSAMLLPALLVLVNFGEAAGRRRGPAFGLPKGREARDAMLAMLARIASMDGRDTACLILALDDWPAVTERWGGETAHEIKRRCGDRLSAALRRDDLLTDLDDGRFGVVLHPMADARLGLRDALSNRLRAALMEPFVVDGAVMRLTVSIGHVALRQCGAGQANTALAAAHAALADANAAGPNSIRAFAPGHATAQRAAAPLAQCVSDAIATGAIRPWFQPQVDASTGALTGFEALARWHHPELGLLKPDRFLDAVAEAGRIEALGEAVRGGALEALRHWEAAGAEGLTVSVNAVGEELRSPSYADQIAWDLDRHEVAPDRLVVEVLETVAAASNDDAVIATLASLRTVGVGIDLDDFGIGQASLLSIRRFGVQRIKIDRSFVMGVDRDEGQRAMVGAIVSMAHEMGVTTLAEGVESAGEMEALRELGCEFVQGYRVGRPMPLEKTLDWLSSNGGAGAPHRPAEAVLRPAE